MFVSDCYTSDLLEMKEYILLQVALSKVTILENCANYNLKQRQMDFYMMSTLGLKNSVNYIKFVHLHISFPALSIDTLVHAEIRVHVTDNVFNHVLVCYQRAFRRL